MRPTAGGLTSCNGEAVGPSRVSVLGNGGSRRSAQRTLDLERANVRGHCWRGSRARSGSEVAAERLSVAYQLRSRPTALGKVGVYNVVDQVVVLRSDRTSNCGVAAEELSEE